MLTLDLKTMLTCTIWFLFVSSACALLPEENTDPYTRSHFLDRQGNYFLEWSVDWNEKSVAFAVTVKTNGYVGFGLSKRGKMAGADIVIGGVHSDGSVYFSDRHAVANQLPIEDSSQDWTLHNAWENYTHTFLSFSRAFDTCDEDHDLPINDDTISIIWAFGEHDHEIQYHFGNRGTFNAYLLDPDLTPTPVHNANFRGDRLTSLGDWDVWTLSMNQDLPFQETTYLCTFHQAPHHHGKRHMVGFRTVLDTDFERRHIHHYILHRCYPPRGQDPDEFFGRFLGRPGERCYIFRLPSSIPSQYCSESVHVWTEGGPPVFLPDHLGVPIEAGEYYMWQVHYDNPQFTSGVNLNFALEVYYTDQLRKYDAGGLITGAVLAASPSIIIPSNSLAHSIYGICGAGCTQKMFPPEGLHVVAANMHTHSAGVSVRALHIRNGRELEPIMNDDNYKYDYQVVKILRGERIFMPGDQIVTKCVYDTRGRNGNATVGGFSKLNEMCNLFVYYYPYNTRGTFAVCTGEITSREYKDFVQVWNTTWSDDEIDYVVTAPAHNAGATTKQVATRTEWTLEKRRRLEHYHRYLPQLEVCPDLGPDAVEQSSAAMTTPYYHGFGRFPLWERKFEAQDDPVEPETFSVYHENTIPYRQPALSCGRRKWLK